MVSNKLKVAVKLSDSRGYQIAHEAGIDPSTLSKLICGIIMPQINDQRVISVGQVLGLKPEECFETGRNDDV